MRGRASTVLLVRLAQVPLVLAVLSALVFVLVRAVPGDQGRDALGPEASPAQVHAWKVAHGLEGSVIEQYLGWAGRLLTGDWGTSIVYAVPVRELVLERAVNSLVLGLSAFVLLVPLALGLGALQARREGSRTDRGLTVGLMALTAVPEFVVGVLLLVGFALLVPLFPVQSTAGSGAGFGPHLRAMVLPAVTLALGSLAVVARTARTGIIDALEEPFHRTAVLKGLHPRQTFRAHVARNALIPTVSVLAATLGALVAGSAVVETLFGYPGLGGLLVTATQRKDVDVLAAGVLLVGLLTLIAVALADVVSVWMDPRVRFHGADA
ncbi:ABC transporter permease [Microbacterium sp. KSW4-16]|uniref:ABC transporter permease n=1 Tax=Microbacterium aurugineum TaxID=2851642 RepID=UPI0020BE9828|nr:ABC transporter permease [Microbacterium aurugineum]MCK8468764.1 ABC transporter permease [Microbacterium aurugineum]